MIKVVTNLIIYKTQPFYKLSILVKKQPIMKYLFLVFCFVTLISCGGDDDQMVQEPEEACSTEIVPTFSITMRDASTNALLEDVSITVMDQSFTVVLPEVSPGVYEGPDEREGSYTLRIEKDNYQTIITGQINPLTDECGLITEVLSYELEEL